MNVQFIAKSIHLMAAMLLGAVAMLMGAPTASSDPHPGSFLAGLEKSIVFLQTKWSGFIQLPPNANANQKGDWTPKLTYSVTCTGFYVSKAAQIVTAGHCVDPEQGRRHIIDGYLRDQNLTNLRHEAYGKWNVQGDMAGAPVGRSVQAVQPNAVDGATLTSPTTIEVVDFRAFDAADVALLHVPNIDKQTPALVVAPNAPQVGDQVTSIGFCGQLQDIADPSQMARASFKSGTVSSRQVTPSGVVRIEVSSQLGPGMSGGPTVNDDGQVDGVNNSGLTTEGGFSFITNTPDLRSCLRSHDVALVAPPAPVFSSGSAIGWYIVGASVPVVAVAIGLTLLLQRRGRRQTAAAGGVSVADPGPRLADLFKDKKRVVLECANSLECENVRLRNALSGMVHMIEFGDISQTTQEKLGQATVEAKRILGGGIGSSSRPDG